MKPVKLKTPLLIGTVNHPAGDTVMVTDVRAAELTRLDHAEAVDGTPAVTNPDHNPLADVIDPEPPGGLIINPVDALAPNIMDNPGLKKAVELGSPKVKVARVQPDDVKEGPTSPAKVNPTVTANEVIPKKA